MYTNIMHIETLSCNFHLVWVDHFGAVCFFYLMLNITFFRLNAK